MDEYKKYCKMYAKVNSVCLCGQKCSNEWNLIRHMYEKCAPAKAAYEEVPADSTNTELKAKDDVIASYKRMNEEQQRTVDELKAENKRLKESMQSKQTSVTNVYNTIIMPFQIMDDTGEIKMKEVDTPPEEYTINLFKKCFATSDIIAKYMQKKFSFLTNPNIRLAGRKIEVLTQMPTGRMEWMLAKNDFLINLIDECDMEINDTMLDCARHNATIHKREVRNFESYRDWQRKAVHFGEDYTVNPGFKLIVNDVNELLYKAQMMNK